MDITTRKISFEKWWPNLLRTGYKVTSPADPYYNCFAWAAGETQLWWAPPTDPFGSFKKSYWPPGVAQENTLEAFIQAYATIGFAVCDNAELEPDFEKIVIYTTNGIPDHAARQLPNGKWTSKIGDLEDIEHALDAFEGGKYFGKVACVLKRSLPISE